MTGYLFFRPAFCSKFRNYTRIVLTEKTKKRKYWKIPAILLGVLGLLVLGFHLWFVNQAENLVEDLVRRQSKGKVELRVKNFKFNWFSKKMELENATFFTTDTTAPDRYLFSVKRLRVQVQSVWPLLMDKKFLIDSLQLIDPDISVTRRKVPDRELDDADSSLSIPQEMGRVYHSIQDALKALQVDKFQIINGNFSLFNQSRPTDVPVRISRINMRLDNLRIDSTTPQAEQKILFSDNVALETHDQDILFPDGRHRLSFRDFRINIENQYAEFDSCTIEAGEADSANSSFRIFFDKLQMTNIDFDTLYHKEVIKADSVYAFNPRIQLLVNLNDNNTGPPKLDQLIQQLTGELEIGFVVVENGSFDINTVRAGVPSSFTSDDNNFILEGLRIRDHTPRPVTVERFEMAIRNYENFIRDSAYAIQFDSILIRDNRISLSNFAYKELEKGRRYNQLRMRQLELYELSWDDLVFNQKVKAGQVTLIQPTISYDIANARRGKKRDIFEMLSTLSHAMQLQRLHIIDGAINLQLPAAGKLNLEHATILLETSQLLRATNARDLRDAIQYLDFTKGNLKVKDYNVDIDNMQFVGGENSAEADKIHVSRGDSLDLQITKLRSPMMVFDEYMRLQSMLGLRWDNASLKTSLQKKNGTSSPLSLLLTQITGGATNLDLQFPDGHLRGQLKELRADQWQTNGDQMQIAGVGFSLSGLVARKGETHVRIGRWEEDDKQRSKIYQIELDQIKETDSVQLRVPYAEADFQWNDWLNGKRELEWLFLQKPQLLYSSLEKGNQTPSTDSIKITRLQVKEPHIRFHSIGKEGESRFSWNSHVGDSIHIDGFTYRSGALPLLRASRLAFLLRGMEHINQKGRLFQTGKGLLGGHIRDLQASRNDLGTWDWKLAIDNLQARQFEWDSLGRKLGHLAIDRARIRNMNLESGWLLDLPQFVGKNPTMKIEEVSGSYTDSIDQFYWNNVSYDNSVHRLEIDSFRYEPAVDLATFTGRQRFQADYVKAHTGKVVVGPIGLENFARDSTLSVGNIAIHGGFLDDYRDKRIPREPGIVRALPGNLLKKLPFRFESDTIRVENAFVRYEEMDEKSNKAGMVEVTNLNGEITGARNYRHQPGDSLRIFAKGQLAGTIPTLLWVNESYTDTLGGFRMRVNMEQGDLTVLNPILAALARAELKSGILDSLRMQVSGQESFAYGEMELYYRDLKVRVIREKPKSLGARLTNFLANTIIKNRNKGKGGTVYVERLRDRSAINYLVKITLSGVMTNIGIKSPKKQARKNRKAIREMLERQHPKPASKGSR